MIGKESVIILTARYSKLTRAMPTGKKLSSHVANVYFNFRIVLYDISAYDLRDNGVQYELLLATLCIILGVDYLTTAAYHLEMNGQVER